MKRFLQKNSGRVTAFVVAVVALWIAVVIIGLRGREPNPYPKTQNGLTLAAYHTSKRQSRPGWWGGFTTFVWRHFSPASSLLSDTEFPTLEIALPAGAKTGAFEASAKTPTGETFALGCIDLMPGNTPEHTFVRVPDVPANYPFLDVTVSDKSGHAGTWRVSDLPRMKHALSPNTLLHETELAQGVKLTARAWWDAKAAPPISVSGGGFGVPHALPVVCEIKAVPSNAASHPFQWWSWGVAINQITHEWEPFSASIGASPASGFSESTASRGGTGGIYAKAKAALAPHPSAQHVAQINAVLSQYDRMEETVTFHDVPLERSGNGLRVRVPQGGLSLLSPSGVRVSLSAPAQAFAGFGPIGFNDVEAGIAVTPEKGFLAASPLQKRVGKEPLQVSWYVDYDGEKLTSMMSSEKTVRFSYKKRLPRPVLPELTVHVTQEVVLQTAPVSFTVPVTHGKPKEKWVY